MGVLGWWAFSYERGTPVNTKPESNSKPQTLEQYHKDATLFSSCALCVTPCHPLLLITPPYIAQCMGAWSAKGS